MTRPDQDDTGTEAEKPGWMAKSRLYRGEDQPASRGIGLVVSIDVKPSCKVLENGSDTPKAAPR